MPLTLPPVVEPLGRNHDREHFDCGEPALNDYLRGQAAQDARRGVSRIYVAHERGAPKVLGYYTLSATSFSKKSLPESEAKRLPHYPIPAALLGRLAVDSSCHGKGLGKFLLFDGLHRVLQAAESLAVYALVVDAKNDNARAFYEHYGFIRFPDSESRLFVPVETLRSATGQRSKQSGSDPEVSPHFTSSPRRRMRLAPLAVGSLATVPVHEDTLAPRRECAERA